jgi:hypothetical protein
VILREKFWYYASMVTPPHISVAKAFTPIFLATALFGGIVMGQTVGQGCRGMESQRDCDNRIRSEQVLNNSRLQMERIKAETDRIAAMPIIRTPSEQDRRAMKQAGKEVAELRKIDPADVEKYRAMAGSKGALIKLFPDHDCARNGIVIRDGLCSEYVFSSTAYSFRHRAYWELAGTRLSWYDVHFNNGKLVSKAPTTLGTLVLLGEVPLETVDLTRPPVDHLAGMKPPETLSGADDMARKLEEGIDAGGYVYTSNIAVKENATYALRLMAYDDGLRPNFSDKADDLLVVFRIVKRYPDGSILLASKTLQRKKAPKLRSSEESGRPFQIPFE